METPDKGKNHATDILLIMNGTGLLLILVKEKLNGKIPPAALFKKVLLLLSIQPHQAQWLI